MTGRLAVCLSMGGVIAPASTNEEAAAFAAAAEAMTAQCWGAAAG